MTREQAVTVLCTQPYKVGHLLGFTKLTELHNGWMHEMICGKDDYTLQAHRGSYKTTCVSLALAIIMIVRPTKHVMFMRKTDTDTKEIIKQVKKILESQHMRYFVNLIWGINLELVSQNQSELTTNLCQDTKGTAQLFAMGTGGSITGKHFDYIFTDDIINKDDRVSRAEREKTKLAYQELQNIKNRDGRIFNTGTPWHKEDAFTLMPNVHRHDCYQTGLISNEELETLKGSMTSSLFAANYELRHIAEDDVLFFDPHINSDPDNIVSGIAHIDASYGGEDGTAFTICKKVGDKYYLFGKLYQKHVDDCLTDILSMCRRYDVGKIYCEDNGDKGYLAKDLRNKGERVANYHENTNKYIKITSYLKATWKDVEFIKGTDEAYINQICDYNENAEHDDAPDSAASIIRVLWKKKAPDHEMIWM